MFVMLITGIMMSNFAYGYATYLNGPNAASVSSDPTGIFVISFVLLLMGIWCITVDRKLQSFATSFKSGRIDRNLVNYAIDRQPSVWVFWNLIQMLLCFGAIFICMYLRPGIIFYVCLGLSALQLFLHIWFDFRPKVTIRNFTDYQADLKYQARKDVAILIVLLTIVFVVLFDLLQLVVDTKSFVYAIVSLSAVIILTIYWYFKMPTSSYLQYTATISSLMTVAMALLLLPYPG